MMGALRWFGALPWYVKAVFGIALAVVAGMIFPPPNPPGEVLSGPAANEAGTVASGVSDRYTGPPDGLKMPYTWQIVMICITGGMSLALLIYAIRLSRRLKTVVPLLIWIGALLAVVLEPVADVMANVIHSPEGSWTVFTVEGHPIPWHVLLCYPWYFGGLAILIYERMVDKSIERRFWWDHYIHVGILVPLVEVIPAHYGVWIYYGEQPFFLGATPGAIAAANICAVMLPTLFLYIMLPKLTGWKQYLVVPMIPALAMAGHAGSGVIYYLVCGQNTVDLPGIVVEASLIPALGMSVLLVWLLLEFAYGFEPVSEVAERETEDRVPVAA